MTEYDERFFDKRQADVIRSARAVVPIVLELLSPRSVVDVGCARGEWLSVYRELGVGDVAGVDGEYVDTEKLLVPRDCFRARDLSQGLELEGTFDLATSLEVAEHLPAGSSDRFIASLVKLAPAILFSAAIPYQGGTGHVNEQWPGYWAERFARHGYVPVDAIRPRVWTNEDVHTWYRQNTLLYVRPSLVDANPRLREEQQRTRAGQLDVVLPEFYARRANPSTKRLWKALRGRMIGGLRSVLVRGAGES